MVPPMETEPELAAGLLILGFRTRPPEVATPTARATTTNSSCQDGA